MSKSLLSIRRDLFALADRMNIELSAPHQAVYIPKHPVLMSGAYWMWTLRFTSYSQPLMLAALINRIQEIYTGRLVIFTFGPPDVMHFEAFIQALPDEPVGFEADFNHEAFEGDRY